MYFEGAMLFCILEPFLPTATGIIILHTYCILMGLIVSLSVRRVKASQAVQHP